MHHAVLGIEWTAESPRFLYPIAHWGQPQPHTHPQIRHQNAHRQYKPNQPRSAKFITSKARNAPGPTGHKMNSREPVSLPFHCPLGPILTPYPPPDLVPNAYRRYKRNQTRSVKFIIHKARNASNGPWGSNTGRALKPHDPPRNLKNENDFLQNKMCALELLLIVLSVALH